MTRKDYILIAEALRGNHTELIRQKNIVPEKGIEDSYMRGSKDGSVIGSSNAIRAIADVLAKDNPRFDREHFLAVVRGERALNSKPPRKAVAKPQHDFTVENHGSIFLLRPWTPEADNWIVECLPPDVQFMGSAVAVEPRYVADIVKSIKNDGLTII